MEENHSENGQFVGSWAKVIRAYCKLMTAVACKPLVVDNSGERSGP